MNVYFSKKIEENFKKELKHSKNPLVIMKEKQMCFYVNGEDSYEILSKTKTQTKDFCCHCVGDDGRGVFVFLRKM